MAGILVDTDVLAEHLRGLRRFEAPDSDVYVSAIARAELVGARNTDVVPVVRLLGTLREIPVDGSIAARAGLIRSQSGVTLADALIAATAIEHDLTLVTHNLFGFRAIDGLRAMAPPTG